MKTSHKSDYIISAVVVACSVVLLGALTVALSGFRFTGAGGPQVEIYFPSVAGIRINSQVRYAGRAVGSVSEMTFLTPEEIRELGGEYVVRVTADLQSDAPALYQGTHAGIVSDTILAEKFVNLSAPDFAGLDAMPQPLQPGEPIFGSRMVDFDELSRTGSGLASAGLITMEKISQLVDSLNSDYDHIHGMLTGGEVLMSSAGSAAEEVQALLASLRETSPDLASRIGSIVENSDETMQNARQAMDEASALLADVREDYPDLRQKVTQLLDNGEKLASVAQAMIERVNEMIENNDENVNIALKELRVVLQNLKVTSTYTKAFTRTVGERPWRIVWGGEPHQLPSEKDILENGDPIQVDHQEPLQDTRTSGKSTRRLPALNTRTTQTPASAP
jgi:ABC-type transporter Mla subunit MlaD